MSETAGSQPPPPLPSIYSSCNGKLLLAAVVCLALVVSFVLLLHIYARCFLRPRRRDPLDVEGHFFVRRGRRSLRVEALPMGYLGAAVFFAAAGSDGGGGGGLDTAAIASLPVFVYRKEATKEHGGVADENGKKVGNWIRPEAAAPSPPECAVCLSEMEDGEAGRELPGCGHCFHVECIDMWLAARPTCPVCRATVKVPEAENKDQREAMAVPDQGIALEVSTVEEVVASDGMRSVGTSEQFGEGRRSTSCALGSDPAVQVIIEQVPTSTSTSSCSANPSSSTSSSSPSTSSSLSTSATSTATTSLGCSLKRMLSRSRSDSRKVFPSAAAANSGGEQ